MVKENVVIIVASDGRTFCEEICDIHKNYDNGLPTSSEKVVVTFTNGKTEEIDRRWVVVLTDREAVEINNSTMSYYIKNARQ